MLVSTFFSHTDGCQSTTTSIPSVSGDGNLTITITWPETNLAEVAVVTCPCGTLNITAQVATRRCGGNFINGAQWDTANVDPCNLSDNARRICQLSEVLYICFFVPIISVHVIIVKN